MSTGCFSPTPNLADIYISSFFYLTLQMRIAIVPLKEWLQRQRFLYGYLCIPTTQYCTWFKGQLFNHSSNSQWEALSKELFFKIKIKKPQSNLDHGYGIESFYLPKSVWNTESIQRRRKRKTTLWLPGFSLFKHPLKWFHWHEAPEVVRLWEAEGSMVVARDPEKGGLGGCLAGQGFSLQWWEFWRWWRYLQNMNVLNCHLKMVTVVKFKLHIFYHNLKKKKNYWSPGHI